MEEPKDVFVFAEVQDGAVAEVSLELLAKARELASALGGATGAFLLGSGLDALPQTLFEHGCDEVRVADDPALAHYTTLPYADVLVNMIRERGPARGLYGAKVTGGGCGGSVAVLMADHGTAWSALEEACSAYSAKTGKQATLLRGSSPGAAGFGVRPLD